jgi:molybdate transport system ATP-binding protein
VGYVFQEASLFPHLTVRRNLEYGLKRIPGSRRRVTFDQAVELLGLETKLDRLPGGLSGGESKRVAIARALLTCPRLLLMDEPLAGLDQKSKNEIIPSLDRLRKELDIPVFYVSHVLDEVARLADQMVLMEAGSVRATGPIGEVLTRVDLQIARGDDAQAVIDAEVDDYDDRYDLSYLRFAGGCFTVARRDFANGQAVRLRVLARDVSLTLEKQSSTSILNIFPATVENLADDSPAHVMVRLNAGGIPVLSRVTRKSVETLGLKPGKKLFAQVKSVALLV